ncbi:MAG: hypothetical protein ACTSWW_00795 [Promethearchaeota archaeon]
MHTLLTKTSWQKTQTKLVLMDMKEAISPYPLIERRYFDDLNALCRSHTTYNVEMGLLQIFNHTNQELNADFWILIWALDFQDRQFQLLIERHPDYEGRGAIAGVGPNDFLEFLSGMKQNAILPTLTLLNSPEKMKSVVVVVSQPKSYKETRKEKSDYQALGRFQNWINQLKATPNVKGDWFPANAPTCPVCGSPVVGIADGYKVGFGFLICPECGYNSRAAVPRKQPKYPF